MINYKDYDIIIADTSTLLCDSFPKFLEESFATLIDSNKKIIISNSTVAQIKKFMETSSDVKLIGHAFQANKLIHQLYTSRIFSIVKDDNYFALKEAINVKKSNRKMLVITQSSKMASELLCIDSGIGETSTIDIRRINKTGRLSEYNYF